MRSEERQKTVNYHAQFAGNNEAFTRVLIASRECGDVSVTTSRRKGHKLWADHVARSTVAESVPICQFMADARGYPTNHLSAM